jgi:prepilin-type N-terminal cleavage/methylation domain-containing protein
MRGFTLAELLTAVAVLALLAGLVLPGLAVNDDRRLEVAAAEVRDALRFARAEAMRRAKKSIFDAESSPGRIKVILVSTSGCSSYASAGAATDPRTKRDFDVDIVGGAFSAGVTVTPRFLAPGGTAYGGVVFDSSGAAVDACQVTGMDSKGTPQAGSEVVLALGARQVSVALDVATGRVTGP